METTVKKDCPHCLKGYRIQPCQEGEDVSCPHCKQVVEYTSTKTQPTVNISRRLEKSNSHAQKSEVEILASPKRESDRTTSGVRRFQELDIEKKSKISKIVELVGGGFVVLGVAILFFAIEDEWLRPIVAVLMVLGLIVMATGGSMVRWYASGTSGRVHLAKE